MTRIVPVLTLLLCLLLLPFKGATQEAGSFMRSVKPMDSLQGVDRTMLIAYAKQYMGTPYRKAGADPKKGFDCSGFVSYIFKHFNITLPRSSKDYKALGASLKPEEFRVGDVLVFYGFRDKSSIGHVGIICEANGMKSKFIHASSGRAHQVTISDLDSEGYRDRFFKCISRIR